MASPSPKNILVRAPNWIGDQVLAYPFFHYLRAAYPEARIGVSCVSWVEALQFRKLVDEVHVLPRLLGQGLKPKLVALEEGARALRERGPWDLAISMPNSLSAAWLLYRSGASRRRGYRGDGRGWLLNERLAWDPDPGRHRAQAYVDLLPGQARPERPVKEFWGILPENELDPGVPGELAAFDAEGEWPEARPLEPPTDPYWVLAPGATAESRRWPLESFVALADQVARSTGWRCLIVGGPAEAGLAEQLVDKLNRPGGALFEDWTARGSVTDLWWVFGGAKVTLTNESGLAHVAALCGSPVQIVCGAADPKRTRPLGPGRVQVAINPVECWPCERNVCSQTGGKKIQCLRGISPETIWEEIRRVSPG